MYRCNVLSWPAAIICISIGLFANSLTRSNTVFVFHVWVMAIGNECLEMFVMYSVIKVCDKCLILRSLRIIQCDSLVPCLQTC